MRVVINVDPYKSAVTSTVGDCTPLSLCDTSP